jgi:hypothetical protein
MSLLYLFLIRSGRPVSFNYLQTFITLLCGTFFIIGGLALVAVSRKLQIYSYPLLTEIFLGRNFKGFVDFLVLFSSLTILSCHSMFIYGVLAEYNLPISLIIFLTLVLLSWIRKLWKLSFNYVSGNIITFVLLVTLLFLEPPTSQE